MSTTQSPDYQFIPLNNTIVPIGPPTGNGPAMIVITFIPPPLATPLLIDLTSIIQQYPDFKPMAYRISNPNASQLTMSIYPNSINLVEVLAPGDKLSDLVPCISAQPLQFNFNYTVANANPVKLMLFNFPISRSKDTLWENGQLFTTSMALSSTSITIFSVASLTGCDEIRIIASNAGTSEYEATIKFEYIDVSGVVNQIFITILGASANSYFYWRSKSKGIIMLPNTLFTVSTNEINAAVFLSLAMTVYSMNLSG